MLAMTNSEQALRDFAEKQFPLSKELKKEVLYNQIQQAKQNECLSDLTALISEGYVSKEEHDKVVQQRDELLKTMKSIYCTTDASDQTSMQHAIYRIGAAIKNTEKK